MLVLLQAGCGNLYDQEDFRGHWVSFAVEVLSSLCKDNVGFRFGVAVRQPNGMLHTYLGLVAKLAKELLEQPVNRCHVARTFWTHLVQDSCNKLHTLILLKEPVFDEPVVFF